jgi:hypothetical protein
MTDANGLLYMRARYYNPYLCRFINPDPVGFSGGMNFYAYADGNPVSNIDPFGFGALSVSAQTWVQTQQWYKDLQAMNEQARFYQPTLGQQINTLLDFVPGGLVAKSFYTLSTGRELGTGAWTQQSDWATFGQGVLGAATLAPLATARGAATRVASPAANTETMALQRFYPVNNGFAGATERTFLMPGQTIDRYGGSGYSRFFSPAGTAEAARALPPGTAGQSLRSFEVMKPFEVQSGSVAPWFNQPGGGLQYVTPVNLQTLLKRGILNEVTP